VKCFFYSSISHAGKGQNFTDVLVIKVDERKSKLAKGPVPCRECLDILVARVRDIYGEERFLFDSKIPTTYANFPTNFKPS
jgi:hypothetical protein